MKEQDDSWIIPLWLNQSTAMKYVGITNVHNFMEFIQRAKICPSKIGKRWYYSRKELETMHERIEEERTRKYGKY
ncbi:MAG: hypothetical protein AAF655_12550 [Bacteroidota bacterium]